MRRVWPLVLCGCGRLGFGASTSSSDAASADTSVDDAVAVDGAMTAVCHTGTWSTPQVIGPTATGSQESDPGISIDELTLYFGSNRVGGMGMAIWKSTRAGRTSPFGTPTLVAELDVAGFDYDPSPSADGLTMYFGSQRGGQDEIYVATRTDVGQPFGAPTVLPITNDGTIVRGAPDVSADGLELYYSRGALEVAFAQRATTSVGFTFVSEIDQVNAPPTDGNPTISSDGLELFFDSYRNGPAAIFRATRTDPQDLFSGPMELPELAAVANSMGAGTPEISHDGRTLYYFINVGGQLDLYTSTRSCD